VNQSLSDLELTGCAQSICWSTKSFPSPFLSEA